jgi:DNA-binding NtrC family response regulator
MTTHVLLVDDNVSRSADRQRFLVTAGVEIITACDEYRAVEVIKSHGVDVICIDAEFVVNRGSWLGAFIKRQTPFVLVVLIADDDRIPDHFEKHVDIVIDRADFAISGRGLIRELLRGHVPFFHTWLEGWMNRATKSERGEPARTY